MPKTYSQGDIVTDAKGNRLQLVGSQWLPIESVQDARRRDLLDKNAQDLSPAQAFLVSAGHALGGGYLFGDDPGAMEALSNAHPVASFAGAAAPAVVAGVATGGASAALPLAGRMGVMGATEAAMGALGNPENPGSAALMSGVLGGALPGVVPALGAAARYAGRAVGGAREAFDLAAMGTPGIANRVQARIMAAAEGDTSGAAGAPGGASVPPGGGMPPPGGFIGPQGPAGNGGYFEGFLTPDEAAAQGIPLTPGDQLKLAASNADQASFADRLRRAEELRSTDPVFGRAIGETREAQKAWVTQRVAQAAGMDPAKPLTDAAIGQAFTRVGQVFDDVAQQVGEVPLSKGTIGQLEGILLDNSHRSWISQIAKVHKELVGFLEKGNDVLGASEWQEIQHTLNKRIASATSDGDIGYLNKLHDYQGILQDAMLDTAPPQLRSVLQAANEQYRMLKILTRTQGVRTSDGEVNLPSLLTGFGNNPARFKTAGESMLLRQLNTVRDLQTKLVPSSGTAERILANLPRAATNLASSPLAWGISGLAGYKLFGNQ